MRAFDAQTTHASSMYNTPNSELTKAYLELIYRNLVLTIGHTEKVASSRISEDFSLRRKRAFRPSLRGFNVP